MRLGYAKRVTHLVDVGVDALEDSIEMALCGASVRLGPPEELRLGQVPDCRVCWEGFSARASGHAQAAAAMESTEIGDGDLTD